MNKVQSGVLNNVESYLNQLKLCSDVNEAKQISTDMINTFSIKPEKKSKYIDDVNKKSSLTDVLMFAYNMNLSAEGLKIS